MKKNDWIIAPSFYQVLVIYLEYKALHMHSCSCNPRNTLKWALTLFPFYRWENWGIRKAKQLA